MGNYARVSILDGVKLKVTPKKNWFNVELIIPKGTYLPKNSKNNLWSINFRLMGGNRTVENTIKIEFENQRYNKRNLSEVFEKIFTLDNKVEVRLCIQPAFYLSERLREQYWTIKEQERKEQKKAQRPSYAGICTKVSRESKTNPKYTYKNLYKPYQGGGCSPK